jgi:hypothetical protein
MPSAAQLRTHIESLLAKRIPSALTPVTRSIHITVPTGIAAVDELLPGGLPLGAISEIVGPECSGRTTLAMSLIAGLTQAGQVCAWVDVSDALDIESAAANGTDLSRLLWVRCGVATSSSNTCSATSTPRQNFHTDTKRHHPAHAAKHAEPHALSQARKIHHTLASGKPWGRLDQALRVADLILQSGGFSALVLDLGSIAPEYASRIPLATWFRFRAAADHARTSLLLLTQHSCAKSSAGLLLRMQAVQARSDEKTIVTGFDHQVEAARIRFEHKPDNMVPLRKPPQRVPLALWQTHTSWAGTR